MNLIYDPTDLSVAMDENGHVYRQATDGECPEWVPAMEQYRREFPNDDFTRPVW